MENVEFLLNGISCSGDESHYVLADEDDFFEEVDEYND